MCGYISRKSSWILQSIHTTSMIWTVWFYLDGIRIKKKNPKNPFKMHICMYVFFTCLQLIPSLFCKQWKQNQIIFSNYIGSNSRYWETLIVWLKGNTWVCSVDARLTHSSVFHTTVKWWDIYYCVTVRLIWLFILGIVEKDVIAVASPTWGVINQWEYGTKSQLVLMCE